MIILIIGLGSIGKKHVDAIYALKLEVTIYALRGGSSMDFYREVINISSVDEIQKKIDFIVVSNITSAHEATITSVFELQCPIFIEKPVLSDFENASRISGKLKEKNILTYVACNLRFHSGLQFLKKYLDEKKPRINEVNIYCGSYLPDWRSGIDFRKSYSANFDQGGGVHLDLIHELDYCTWLFGFPEKATSIKRDVSSLSINAVDNAKFEFSYTNFTAGINLNYYRRDAKRTLEVVTSEDSILLDLRSNIIQSLLTGNIIYNEAFEIKETYMKQMRYFINVINSNKRTINDFDYAVKILKLANDE
ncbi:Gfo/Idh/MocA family oxidoreductase [Cyclobacteriaceae bacterium]|nr:Gfo/Idh/MocA family oxidoreductase [Cyclobacteriaceae bacterium]MDB4316217.1 Gfo/Idh/MocA family oxidoreductase [Cyclobacteriaceae bacterium]MDB4605746.1 Gfo/Idh/MocA family oxidoreductase [Cyclobacteriaceae bacterium]|tara:strand:+ start:2985 stop:3905 length:921 start_codon:yes stop_codon:yes gene_type:complete